MKQKVIFFAFCLLTLCLGSCGGNKIQVNGMQSTVRSVISGNKVELQNGTKVVLLGIKDSENAKKYLEQHVKGKRVRVIADSKQPPYINSYLTTIYAYLRVEGDKGCVQSKLLQTRLSMLNPNQRCDSTKVWSELCAIKTHPLVSSSELRTMMLPSTFLVYTEKSMGTGFFINNNGLALTNNHVWDGSTDAVVYMINDNGGYDASNTRQISRVIATYKEGNIDFTIFVVQLDNNERTSYLPIIGQRAAIGDQVGKLGCALGRGAMFNTGVISRYNEGYLTHSINIDNGDSGSPLCNMRGEVVGVNVSVPINPQSGSESRGMSFAVDALLIKEVLDELGVEYGR